MSLQEIENMVTQLADVRNKIEELKNQEKELSKVKYEIEQKIMFELKAVGNDSYKSSLGTAYISTSLSYKMPKEEDNRSKLFDYLKEQNTFDTLITINSNTFNAWCKAEMESAKESGVFPFSIPGVDEPISYEQLRFRKN